MPKDAQGSTTLIYFGVSILLSIQLADAFIQTGLQVRTESKRTAEQMKVKSLTVAERLKDELNVEKISSKLSEK